MPFPNPAYKINPAIGVLLVFAMASLSCYFWERPIVNWSHKFVSRRMNKPARLSTLTAPKAETKLGWKPAVDIGCILIVLPF
jgi:peptidoglycan/LPS O-acetylase OafA/YrhL